MSLGKVWTRDDQVGRCVGVDEVIWETKRRGWGSEGRLSPDWLRGWLGEEPKSGQNMMVPRQAQNTHLLSALQSHLSQEGARHLRRCWDVVQMQAAHFDGNQQHIVCCMHLLRLHPPPQTPRARKVQTQQLP